MEALRKIVEAPRASRPGEAAGRPPLGCLGVLFWAAGLAANLAFWIVVVRRLRG